MKIRNLSIRILTDGGMFGTDISFPDGLVIIRADNSMGKSTCVHSILVGLGMEAMLTASQTDLPVNPVFKEKLEYNHKTYNVLESNIYLEIENHVGERIVINRTVKGARHKDLMTVIFGPLLSKGDGNYLTEDFFVTRKGSATREKGFHYFLAGFLGWDLPEVQTYDSRQVPLYMQYIFPYFFVEQKRGWSSLIPPVPTQFRIREPHKRVIEFLLKLDADKIAAHRLEISSRLNDVERIWEKTITEVEILSSSYGGIVKNLPENPVSDWPPINPPFILIPKVNEWIPLDDNLNSDILELSKMKEIAIPTVSQVSEVANTELITEQEGLVEMEILVGGLLNKLEMDRAEVTAIETRLARIREDVQRNKDARTIMSLGSLVPNLAQLHCPTCHQTIQDSLLFDETNQPIMTIDENIKFLEEQERTFSSSLVNAKKIVVANEAKLFQFRQVLSQKRAKIRSLQDTLISDDRLPSAESIQKRVELEMQVRNEKILQEKFSRQTNKLDDLSKMWKNLQIEKIQLPKEDVSESDKQKISKWNQLFNSQLTEYNFKSISIDEISISTDTYMPIHEGFDLPTNISASDFIRIIWSYLTGLLELSRYFKTNHLGFLLFDEPRQQSADKVSFRALMIEVAKSISANQQVIITTSEKMEDLNFSLMGVEHTMFPFSERIIQPISGK